MEALIQLWWEQLSGKLKMIMVKYTTSYYQIHIIYHQLKQGYYHHKKGRDSYCVTYHDAIIMRWNKDKDQITAPLDNRKHRNVGVVRSAPGNKQYLTVCRV
jgi:hypothetical protein